MASFVLSQQAKADIAEILDYIAERDPVAWIGVNERFGVVFRQLGRNPWIGHTREDLTGAPVRFWPVGSYLIVYDPLAQPMRVLRVLSRARDVGELLDDVDREGAGPGEVRETLRYGRARTAVRVIAPREPAVASAWP